MERTNNDRVMGLLDVAEEELRTAARNLASIAEEISLADRERLWSATMRIANLGQAVASLGKALKNLPEP